MIRLLLSVCFFFLPYCIWGQKGGFASVHLQQKAILLAKEVPHVWLVYQFAENYLGELSGLSTQERQRKMLTDGVVIEIGGMDSLERINSGTSLSIFSGENHYKVCFINKKDTLISMSFSMSYQQVRQKKLVELEMEFIRELMEYTNRREGEASVVDKASLVMTAPHLYIRKGASYYIESVNNDTYFIEDSGQINPVFDPSYIIESAKNLLLCENISHDLLLDLTVRQYGFRKDKLEIPLKQWIAYCKEKGCDLYLGVEEMKTDRLRAVVFVVNDPFKYNHVLTADIPFSLLGKKGGRIDADITIFVPMHNVKELFAELDMENNR